VPIFAENASFLQEPGNFQIFDEKFVKDNENYNHKIDP
jgi:hypothetical protein